MYKTAYHYINARNLEKVQETGFLDPSNQKEGYIFCFGDSKDPLTWVDNVRFKGVFQDLLCSISGGCDLLCLEFKINQSDEAYVRDWAFCEKNQEDCQRMEENPAMFFLYALSFPLQLLIQSAREKKMRKSTVPLSKYHGDYSLPELLFKNPIDTERIGRIISINSNEFSRGKSRRETIL